MAHPGILHDWIEDLPVRRSEVLDSAALAIPSTQRTV